MRRRGVLALLAPLTAGCLGGVEVNRQGATSGPDGAEGGESTTTATPASTPASTATPQTASTVDGSTDRQAATRRLRVANDRLRESVTAYADGEALADVDADSDTFVARAVYTSLVEAAGAVQEARAHAATDEQVERAEALSGVVAFLSRATAGQAAMAAGHDALLGVPEALRAGDVARARALVDELGTHRRAVERAASLIRSESSDADVETTDVVADDARQLKLGQFDAAVVAMDDAARPTRALIDGVERLIEARAAATDEDDDEASSLAADAETVLDDAEADLSTVASDLPSEAASFADGLTTLSDYADARAAEAADIRRLY